VFYSLVKYFNVKLKNLSPKKKLSLGIICKLRSAIIELILTRFREISRFHKALQKRLQIFNISIFI